jgi:hypothetical protein
MFDKAPFKPGESVQVTDRHSAFYGEVGLIRVGHRDGKSWRFLLHMSKVPGTPEIMAEHLEKV